MHLQIRFEENDKLILTQSVRLYYKVYNDYLSNNIHNGFIVMLYGRN